jgi:hypothetical protein
MLLIRAVFLDALVAKFYVVVFLPCGKRAHTKTKFPWKKA